MQHRRSHTESTQSNIHEYNIIVSGGGWVELYSYREQGEETGGDREDIYPTAELSIRFV